MDQVTFKLIVCLFLIGHGSAILIKRQNNIIIQRPWNTTFGFSGEFSASFKSDVQNMLVFMNTIAPLNYTISDSPSVTFRNTSTYGVMDTVTLGNEIYVGRDYNDGYWVAKFARILICIVKSVGVRQENNVDFIPTGFYRGYSYQTGEFSSYNVLDQIESGLDRLYFSQGETEGLITFLNSRMLNLFSFGLNGGYSSFQLSFKPGQMIINHGSWIDAITFNGIGISQVCGTSSGTASSITLSGDESFIKFDVCWSDKVEYLKFYTNKGQQVSGGTIYSGHSCSTVINPTSFSVKYESNIVRLLSGYYI